MMYYYINVYYIAVILNLSGSSSMNTNTSTSLVGMTSSYQLGILFLYYL